jgi:aryl-alcohol dehydrogenase (NADP+)
VRAGKVRFLGASSMFAWQFAKSLRLAAVNNWTPFATMQDHYNLLYREAEREMIPLCRDEEIAFLPWSPLARGRLTRAPSQSTLRSGNDRYIDPLYDQADPAHQAIVAAVREIAAQRGASPAQVALAWIRSRPGITAPVVGVTSMAHLEDALTSLEFRLSDEEIRRVTEPYRPRPHAMFGSG